MKKTFRKFIDDESLASEDWRCLFLIALTLFTITAGLLINLELAAPMDYCNPDFCVRILGGK